jgi:RNA polymerase sigma-70 factor (ECF subfamily)
MTDSLTPTVESIWAEFTVKLGRFIRARVADPATAEDIRQDVFLKIQSRLDQLKDPARLPSWLYLITRNAIIDHYRTHREAVEVTESFPAEPPQDDVEMNELTVVFRRMIYSLPEPYRDALVLTEFEGLTQKELAERLGISLSGAKSRVQRGRDQLKQMLLDCCHLEFDRRAGILDCQPRTKDGYQDCSA